MERPTRHRPEACSVHRCSDHGRGLSKGWVAGTPEGILGLGLSRRVPTWWREKEKHWKKKGLERQKEDIRKIQKIDSYTGALYTGHLFFMWPWFSNSTFLPFPALTP